MNNRSAPRLGWLIFGVTVACLVTAVAFAALRGSHPLPAEVTSSGVTDAKQTATAVAVVLGFAVFGALIVARHPSHPIGWLFLAVGFATSINTIAFEYALRSLFVSPGSLPAGEAAAWISAIAWIGGVPLIGTVIAIMFPTGRLPSPRWRPLFWAAIVVLGGLVVGFGFARGPLGDFPIDNPLGLLPRAVPEAVAAPFMLIVAACVSSLVVRFRRGTGDERQQLRWVAAAGSLFVVAQVAVLVVPGGAEWLAMWVVDATVAVAIAAAGLAILKYRLYDLDLIVNRTLVYGALTAGVIGLYVGVVAGLGALLDTTGLGISLAATVGVAVAVQPLRAALQLRVDRLMYGDRDDPYRALNRLAERLGAAVDPEAVLPAIAEAVAEGLRLPYAAIEIDDDGEWRIAAAYGEHRAGELVALPLAHRGRTVGRLLVASRSPVETLASADLRLLAALARQAGIAAHAVMLAEGLRRSRERILAARAEERRRLQRDLHDGLGPMLAGIALEIESARALVAGDQEVAAREVLERLPGEVSDAIADIRRIAHDLRPAAVDELGLTGAIRQQAARLDAPIRQNGGPSGPPAPLQVSVEAPERLPELPAAVEVAVYRIVLEALANVSRHSSARRCWITIGIGDRVLELAIADDGLGLPSRPSAGLGLASMRERAEELGGSFAIDARAGGGTVVKARLPLADGDEGGSERVHRTLEEVVA